jgi:hypothetical protein
MMTNGMRRLASAAAVAATLAAAGLMAAAPARADTIPASTMPRIPILVSDGLCSIGAHPGRVRVKAASVVALAGTAVIRPRFVQRLLTCPRVFRAVFRRATPTAVGERDETTGPIAIAHPSFPP